MEIKLCKIFSVRHFGFISKIYINNKYCPFTKIYIDNTNRKRDTNPADAILKVIEGKENNKPYVTYRLAKRCGN